MRTTPAERDHTRVSPMDIPVIQKTKDETHEERDVVRHHELDLLRQARALGEVDEVLERERERDRLVHLDPDAVEVIVIVVVRVFLLRLLRGLALPDPPLASEPCVGGRL